MWLIDFPPLIYSNISKSIRYLHWKSDNLGTKLDTFRARFNDKGLDATFHERVNMHRIWWTVLYSDAYKPQAQLEQLVPFVHLSSVSASGIRIGGDLHPFRWRALQFGLIRRAAGKSTIARHRRFTCRPDSRVYLTNLPRRDQCKLCDGTLRITGRNEQCEPKLNRTVSLVEMTEGTLELGLNKGGEKLIKKWKIFRVQKFV